MTVFIYGLVCPVAGDIRYIGKAIDPERRLRKHILDARSPKNYNQRWISSLLRNGLSPSVRILCEVPPDIDWRDVEKSYIAHGRSSGLCLTNTSEGGEGVRITDPEVELRRIRKISATWADPKVRSKQSSFLRKRADPEFRAKVGATMREKWLDPDYSSKVSIAVKAAYSSDEARLAQSERSKIAHLNPITRAKRSASLKRAFALNYDAHREAILEANKRPDVKARRSAATKKRHLDPEFRAKIRKALSDPEMIKRRNAAISAGHQRRKQLLKEVSNENGSDGRDGDSLREIDAIGRSVRMPREGSKAMARTRTSRACG